MDMLGRNCGGIGVGELLVGVCIMEMSKNMAKVVAAKDNSRTQVFVGADNHDGRMVF